MLKDNRSNKVIYRLKPLKETSGNIYHQLKFSFIRISTLINLLCSSQLLYRAMRCNCSDSLQTLCTRLKPVIETNWRFLEYLD